MAWAGTFRSGTSGWNCGSEVYIFKLSLYPEKLYGPQATESNARRKKAQDMLNVLIACACAMHASLAYPHSKRALCWHCLTEHHLTEAVLMLPCSLSVWVL